MRELPTGRSDLGEDSGRAVFGKNSRDRVGLFTSASRGSLVGLEQQPNGRDYSVKARIIFVERKMSRHKGAFVYTGAGKKHDKDAPPEQRLCANDAILIQRCMARHNHRQDRCKEEVEAWKRCCKRVKEAAARATESPPRASAEAAAA